MSITLDDIIQSAELEKKKNEFTFGRYHISIKEELLFDKHSKTFITDKRVFNPKLNNFFNLLNPKINPNRRNLNIDHLINKKMHRKGLKVDYNIECKETKEVINIRHYLKNKSVAFVAFGSNIRDKGLGEEIDSHDIVYRTNFYPLPETLHKDYGKRCDVIAIQGAYRKFIPEYIDAGIKLLIYNQIYIEELEGCMYLYTSPLVKNLLKNYVYEIVGNDPGYPTAGLMAYFLSLIFECKSFKYYGITGYQNKDKEIINHDGENNYVKEYMDFWGDRKESIYKTDMKKGTTHRFDIQNKFISLMLSKGLIDMDEYSKPYFQ